VWQAVGELLNYGLSFILRAAYLAVRQIVAIIDAIRAAHKAGG